MAGTLKSAGEGSFPSGLHSSLSIPHSSLKGTLSTGVDGLDRLLTGLIAGDNVICRVDSVADYEPFIRPWCEQVVASGGRVTYFRFADHPPLAAPGPGIDIHELDAEEGFEKFVSSIHRVVQEAGRGGFYLFDMLSGLAEKWRSDRMFGSFFVLTCPFLYDVGAIAYFGLGRGCHAAEAEEAITGTAQVVMDVFRHDGELYIHPLKVQGRLSPTMYMLHAWTGGEVKPVLDSATVSFIMTRGLGRGGARPAGLWERAFLAGEEALASGDRPRQDAAFRELTGLAVTRDPRMQALAGAHLSLGGVLEIGRRMIGTGLIGGKSVGMLVSRAVLEGKGDEWKGRLEPHDSFYVGSDVYYSFVVRNGLWWVRERQKNPATFLDGAETARERMLKGSFPEPVVRHFAGMLDYFGQSPVIVRSSSLLEDNYGNAFAGKYDSVFLANQGSRRKRLEDLLEGVRRVYASTMSEAALRYRAQRGLLERDEQMALLIQRVSGRMYGDVYLPQVSGVALSYNPWVWSEYIEPEAGVMRLVLGLGTRAVDRSDDDYTRVVALNAPERRPEHGLDRVRRYSQRRVDFIDLKADRFSSGWFDEVAERGPDLPLDLFASSQSVPGRLLTFEKLLTETGFVAEMRRMLEVLREAYAHPVETEFTANFTPDGRHLLNLVQCRPLQVRTAGTGVAFGAASVPAATVLEARGAVVGPDREERIERLVYVVPAEYGRMTEQRRYALARLLGRVMHPRDTGERPRTMILGPGRWGTTTPSLGIPVSFAEISTASCICEIVAMPEGLVPDVSLGTHFFNELIEMDILYFALFPDKEGNRLDEPLLLGAPNRLAELVPGAGEFAGAVRVVDPADFPGHPVLRLSASALAQKAVLRLESSGVNAE